MDIAIVGATGNVGRKLLEVIEKLNFEFSELYLIASDKSVGKKITFKNKTYSVVGLSDFDFSKVKIAFFSAGSAIAEKWAPIAAKKTIVIDNSKHFRMNKDIPLVVPEVNAEALKLYKNKNIIANANCSTIQLVLALKPLHDQFKIKRVVVSTYQSVSGAGKNHMTELRSEDAFEKIPHFLAGGGWIEQRSTLEGMVSRNGRPITLGDTEFQIALNDVVLARGAKPRLMRAKAFVDGAEFTSYRADAVIISSATGSTGYNLAVGGPILHPTADEMILKPVAPHVGLATAVVLPATSEVELLIQSDHDSVLSVDGFLEFPLQIEDVIKVKHSEQSVSFIREGSRRRFYDTLMRRLGFESGIGSGRAIFY